MLFKNKNNLYGDVKKTMRLAVAGGSRGCGVSFVSELIAYALVNRGSVSLTELGTPHFYSALGFEKRFLARGYNDFLAKIASEEHFDYAASEKNMSDGISWICKLPCRASDYAPDYASEAASVRHAPLSSDLNTAGIFRAFYMPNEEYCIFDCSAIEQDDKMSLLASADYQVIVIDPLPSKLIEAMDFLEQVRFKYPDAILVVNKMNSGVHTAELNRFLGTKDYFSLPSALDDYIYKAEYNSKSVWTLRQGIDSLQKAQDMLCRVFP